MVVGRHDHVSHRLESDEVSWQCLSAANGRCARRHCMSVTISLQSITSPLSPSHSCSIRCARSSPLPSFRISASSWDGSCLDGLSPTPINWSGISLRCLTTRSAASASGRPVRSAPLSPNAPGSRIDSRRARRHAHQPFPVRECECLPGLLLCVFPARSHISG
jgi:hypothetical protein